MRKAFSLMELITMLAIIGFLSVVFAHLFGTMTVDVPQTTRIFQSHDGLLSLVDRIRMDMDQAIHLPVAGDSLPGDPNRLLIEQRNGIVQYQLHPHEFSFVVRLRPFSVDRISPMSLSKERPASL